MRRLFALILAVALWFGFVQTSPANAYNLTPCKDSPDYQARIELASSASAKQRLEFYQNSGALCGSDGLPHLIPDNFSHLGDFIIPGVMFLYIAGWIGWAGRSYLIAVRKSDSPEMNEIIINVPLAVSKMIAAFAWPAMALAEISSGAMFAKEDEITVSPR
jgi:photosystem I subunit III